MSTLQAGEPSENQEIRKLTGKVESRFSSPLVQERLQAHRLADLEQLFAHRDNVDQRHTGRAVWSTSMEDRKHNRFQVFVKLHEGKIPFLPRLSEFRGGLYKKPNPLREWEGIDVVKKLGLNVPERLALFHEQGRQFRAAVITKEVTGRQSVYQMIENQSWKSLGNEFQAGILDQMMAIIGRIHEGGYGWRGISTGHYFPVLNGDGTWTLSLIDLEGIHDGASNSVVKRDFNKLLKCLVKYNGGDFAAKYVKQNWENRGRITVNSFPVTAAAKAA
ncbi:Lipopolysaccharide kinase (Kdo/WaaP) family protein [Polystyrenella longa]|uniref:Lipopolysaccharide kinase (Kdo/WaaP) family protein n=1 Tax=Polystyrenella longa TaxID=2528007 RepID=A0A518CQW1_9PLAN|nr:lipopolysaccharide kinase InaA family protein [Polystyrenella longa]QDU81617.1 Lipopolysaccharide kinase (Kdo/WaaP) family protein [Polystyrenella longa]